jgi:hypothetical protein
MHRDKVSDHGDGGSGYSDYDDDESDEDSEPEPGTECSLFFYKTNKMVKFT